MQTAAIVYLVAATEASAEEFIISLRLLKKHFLEAYPYPVIALVPDGLPHDWVATILSESGVDVDCRPVALPGGEELCANEVVDAYPIGYLNACRFLSAMVYRHEALAQFEYCWRLDTDSYIMSPIETDLFATLAESGSVYGHLNEIGEVQAPSHRIAGLFEITRDYCSKRHIDSGFLNELASQGEWDGSVFGQGFEVTRVDLWNRSEVLDYTDHLDQTGFIVNRCWSVDAIRAMTLALFVPREKLHLYWDIDLLHQDLEFNYGE